MILSRIIALILLLLIFPIFMIISLVIIFDSGTPIFYKQKRLGQKNKEFLLIKFRTMNQETPEIASHLMENPKEYYTRMGPFLRKFSIDEIPQLINIIKGEMLFIGPRPALHNQQDLIDIRTNCGIHKIKPGITGWAQVNGRDQLSIQDKVDYEKYYLKNRNILFDIRILIMTIKQLLNPRGVSH